MRATVITLLIASALATSANAQSLTEGCWISGTCKPFTEGDIILGQRRPPKVDWRTPFVNCRAALIASMAGRSNMSVDKVLLLYQDPRLQNFSKEVAQSLKVTVSDLENPSSGLGQLVENFYGGMYRRLLTLEPPTDRWIAGVIGPTIATLPACFPDLTAMIQERMAAAPAAAERRQEAQKLAQAVAEQKRQIAQEAAAAERKIQEAATAQRKIEQDAADAQHKIDQAAADARAKLPPVFHVKAGYLTVIFLSSQAMLESSILRQKGIDDESLLAPLRSCAVSDGTKYVITNVDRSGTYNVLVVEGKHKGCRGVVGFGALADE